MTLDCPRYTMYPSVKLDIESGNFEVREKWVLCTSNCQRMIVLKCRCFQSTKEMYLETHKVAHKTNIHLGYIECWIQHILSLVIPYYFTDAATYCISLQTQMLLPGILFASRCWINYYYSLDQWLLLCIAVTAVICQGGQFIITLDFWIYCLQYDQEYVWLCTYWQVD
jgi:hypothetical protein